ncbi:fungal-specific transcription factor domain-containing protein [Aspergillus californicus]
MFSTFVYDNHEKTMTSSASTSTSPPSAPAPRLKRHQVARACDWCRVHRVKCDNSSPCQNCQNRGGRCSKRVTAKTGARAQTLPQALREVDCLQQRVHELEQQLKAATSAVAINSEPSITRRPRKGWDGIHTRTAHSSQTQWYGPSSAFYFIGRMNAYLSLVLEQPQDDHAVQPTSPKHLAGDGSMIDGRIGAEKYLNSIQEDFFLDKFWYSYHPTYQILDEAEFREHYKSLWVDSATVRAPSALVDIILALCMQFGVALTPDSRPDSDVDIADASVAGRWYYRRSQTLLMSDLESPSISTLQCHIFSAVYLCNASFQNMAHTTLALAVRTAQILGLHLEPPVELPRPQRELRRRIWWTLYTVETKTCIKLGRPSSISELNINCKLPADDHELARLSVSNIAANGNEVTWLTYGRLVTTLVLAAQTVHSSYWDKCSELLAASDSKSMYTGTALLEEAAGFLTTQMEAVGEWLQSVPVSMKTKRKNGGEPFSTDGSGLDPERYAPLWLHRQRFLLELLYHNLVMNIYRSFISFHSPSCTGIAEEHSVSCVKHATTITHLLHEILGTNEFLKGWYEAYQWQWNATLSLVGFMLAYPVHPESAGVRAALDTAMAVFEVFGNHFAVAKRAADVTRTLVTKADILSGHISVDPLPGDTEGLLGLSTTDTGILPDDSSTMFQSTLAGAMGLAYNVDSFYSFEPLYAGSADTADAWSFSH